MYQYLGPIDEELDETTKNEKKFAVQCSYEVLRQACIPFEHNDNDALNTETMVWSLVHSYAMLFSADQGAQPIGQAVPDFSEILPQLKLQ